MKTLERFCNAVSFLIMGATACGFVVLMGFANGMEIRLPAGNAPTEARYSHHDRAALERKYSELLKGM